MAFKTSDLPGGFERHLLRRLRTPILFSKTPDNQDKLLEKAIAQDRIYADAFSQQFESVLERTVALKPNEETEVVLEVKAELDRLYTVAASLSGQQASVREALVRLISLTMQSVKKAAGNDAVAVKELQEETEARSMHFKLLENALVADLLNSHPKTGVFIPQEDLVATLLSSDKSDLADVVQLFDVAQASEIIQQAQLLLKNCIATLDSQEKAPVMVKAVENLEFIKGYRVYLESNA